MFKTMLILLNEFDRNNFELNFSTNDFMKKNTMYVTSFIMDVTRVSDIVIGEEPL